MKETLVDLNSMLFEELERLGNEDLSDEQLQKEIQRANAITGISKNIINNAALVLAAAKFNDSKMSADRLPTLLGATDEQD